MGWEFWAILFLIFVLVSPAAQLGVSWARRRRAQARLQAERGSRVIPVILSMGTIATYGLPLARFEELPLPPELVTAVAGTGATTPIDLIVDVPAGLDVDGKALAGALAAHGAPTTLIVPRQALSGGLDLARAVDTVMLGRGATVAGSTGPAGGAAAQATGERPDAIGGAGDPEATGSGERPGAIGSGEPPDATSPGAHGDTPPDRDPRGAAGLRALGVVVDESIPAAVADYLTAFTPPRRPSWRLPFYIALPRLPQRGTPQPGSPQPGSPQPGSPQPADTDHGAAAAAVLPDDGAPRARGGG